MPLQIKFGERSDLLPAIVQLRQNQKPVSIYPPEDYSEYVESGDDMMVREFEEAVAAYEESFLALCEICYRIKQRFDAASRGELVLGHKNIVDFCANRAGGRFGKSTFYAAASTYSNYLLAVQANPQNADKILRSFSALGFADAQKIKAAVGSELRDIKKLDNPAEQQERMNELGHRIAETVAAVVDGGREDEGGAKAVALDIINGIKTRYDGTFTAAEIDAVLEEIRQRLLLDGTPPNRMIHITALDMGRDAQEEEDGGL